VDGEESTALLGSTRDAFVAYGIVLSASNLPEECREFGGRRGWARVYEEMRREKRELAKQSFEEWVLRFHHMASYDFCEKFISEHDLADVHSNQSVLRIVTPGATVRFTVGVNHRRGGKTDTFRRQLPELDFWETVVGLHGVFLEHVE